MTHDSAVTAFARLEADWVALHRAFGERVVADHRGAPLADDPYPARRVAFDAALAAFPRADLDEVEAAGLATIVSVLGFFDEDIALDDGDDEDLAALRRSTIEAYGEAAADIRVDGERLDRLGVFARLATESDPTRREAVFAAMAPLWATIVGDGGPDGPYRRLLRASADRWARSGSVVEANAAVLGIAPGDVEPMLRHLLEAGGILLRDAAGGAPIEPWDYRYLVGAAEREIGPTLDRDRLRGVNDAHLRSLGADPMAVGITYDIEPRDGRPVIPVAFTIGVGIPARPWIFATYRDGGLGNLGELVHESGHALHYAAIRTRPCFAEPPADHAAFFEAVADVIGWDVGEPAFQMHHLGMAVDPATSRLDRYGSVLLDVAWSLFEIELHRHPDRDPNLVWTELTHDGLGIEPHPDLAWWAVRGQLLEAPGYLANYGLGAIATAAIRERIREIRGDWSTGDPGWYAFVAERLLRFGGERPPAALLVDFLDRPLDEGPLLADLSRGAGT